MPTLKHRVNISLSDQLEKALMFLAKRDRVPQATKAADLLQKAIEIEEDSAWDRLANIRDTKKARYVSHEKAWL